MSFVLPRNRSQHWLYYHWVGILRTTMRLSTVPLRRLKLRLMRITFPMKDPSSCPPRRFCGFKKDRAGGQAVAPRGLFRHALDRAEGREGGRNILAISEVPLRIQFVGSGRHEYFKLVSIEKALPERGREHFASVHGCDVKFTLHQRELKHDKIT